MSWQSQYPRFVVAATMARGMVISDALASELLVHRNIIVTPRNIRACPRGIHDAAGEIIWDTAVPDSREAEFLSILALSQRGQKLSVRYVSIEVLR